MKITTGFLLLFIMLISENTFSKQQEISVKKTKPSKKNAKAVKELKPAPLPAHNMGAEWTGVRKADGVSTYKLKSNPKVIATFHLQKKDISLKELKSKDFFKKFVQSKEEWLMMIGIREWNADSHKIKKKKGFTELNVRGSYRRDDGEQVFFRERQLFFLGSVYQILVISPKKKMLQSRSVRSFFKKAQRIELSQRKQKDRKIKDSQEKTQQKDTTTRRIAQ